MLQYFASFGAPTAWDKELGALEALDMGNVKRVGRRVLDRNRAFVMVHQPGSASRGAQPVADATYSKKAAEKAGATRTVDEDRQRPPPMYDFSQPFAEFAAWGVEGAARWDKAEELTLGNGIKCRVIRTGLVPVMTVSATFTGGKIAEPADRHGVAQLLASNTGLPGNANQTASYRMAREMTADVDDEEVTYTWRFLSVYAGLGLELAAEQLRSPQIKRGDVMNTRDNLLRDWVTNAATDADVLAIQAFWKSRGLGRYASSPSRRSLETIDYGDVTDYAARVLYPENLSLAVASDLPVETLRPLLEASFGAWSAKRQPPVDLSSGSEPITPLAAPRLVMVPAASTQSKVMVLLDSVGWTNWQERALASGVSLLVKEKARRIREAMGATYGVGTGNWSFKDFGVFFLTTKVERGLTAAAVRQALKVLDEVRAAPMRPDELELVRRDLIQGILQRARYSRADATHLTKLMVRGRAPDHDRQVVQWASALTLEELQAAVDRMLGRPPLVVVAGQELSAQELATLPEEIGKRVTRLSPDEVL